MATKKLQNKGNIKFSRYFQNLKKGEKVIIKKQAALPAYYPKRLEGKTGEIKAIRGKAYIVKIREFNRIKDYIIQPFHLEKMKVSEKIR